MSQKPWSILLAASLTLLGCNVQEPSEKNELAYAASVESWQPFPGAAKEVAITYGYKPAVIGTNGWIWQWQGNYASGGWSLLGSGASRIATDQVGRPVVTMPDGYVWRFNPATSSWEWMNFPPAREVAIGLNGHTYVVSTYEYPGYPGDYWIAKVNSPGNWTWIGRGREIAVSSADELWDVTANGEIWRLYQGAWRYYPPNHEAPPGTKATDITMGQDHLYVVGNDFDASGNAKIFQVLPGTTTWWYHYDRGVRVASANVFEVFMLKADNSIWYWYYNFD